MSLVTNSHPLNDGVDFFQNVDVYFSADVETDGPIPGPFSMLSFALVKAGSFDGNEFNAEINYSETFYRELKPISEQFDPEALQVNGLDRNRLIHEGIEPSIAMKQAYDWINSQSKNGKAVLVAFPLSFDWSWLYWYFVRFCKSGSPFSHSRCFDMKTAYSVKSQRPITQSGKNGIYSFLKSTKHHSHNALDDAIEQAELFVNIFSWKGQVHD